MILYNSRRSVGEVLKETAIGKHDHLGAIGVSTQNTKKI